MNQQGMNIIILDDYQDAVRKLRCAERLAGYPAKVFTNTVKGIGQLSVRLRDADVLVTIRERTQFPRQLLEKLPRLKLIAQTGPVGPHIDVDACTRLGIAVADEVDVVQPRVVDGKPPRHLVEALNAAGASLDPAQRRPGITFRHGLRHGTFKGDHEAHARAPRMVRTISSTRAAIHQCELVREIRARL